MIRSILQIRRNAARYGGNMWENARFIMADVPLNKAEAKKVLPLGMLLTNPPAGTLFIANYTKTNFTVPYREAALMVHVRTPLGRGLHCCWMVVDDDTALIYGRELLGYPKKMAHIPFDEKRESIKAGVTRRGVQILTMEGKRKSRDDSPQPVFSRKTFNCSGLYQSFIFNPIWLFKPKEIIHESYRAAVSIKLKDSEFDPLARLIAGEAGAGRIAVTDITGSRYMLPVGCAGPGWLKHVLTMRFQ